MEKKENIRSSISNKDKLMLLQKDYEKGIIKEEQLSDYEKECLIFLYKKQIKILEGDVDIKKKELLGYKEKILKVKQKLF